MRTHRTIITYIMSFLLWFGAVFALAYTLIGLSHAGGGENPGITTLFMGGSMLAAIAVLPLFFLKQLARLSRKVEHDDSRFSVKELTAHQRRPKIQYY